MQGTRAEGPPMTARRYRFYRMALDIVAAIDAERISAPGREILEDLAEHMLLSPDCTPADLRELRLDSMATVRELARAGMVPPAPADQLVHLVLGAGPPLPRMAQAVLG